MIETTATARDGLPHDLELVVEAALDCGNGFWGRVWRGAEFDSIRVRRRGPRRRPRSWNRGLTRGYNGWNEDLVGKVVAVLDEAAGRGWSPPARLPDVPAMSVLLDVRRRPPAEAIISRDRTTTAVTQLFEARQEWGSLPVGGSLTRAWQATRARPTAAGRRRLPAGGSAASRLAGSWPPAPADPLRAPAPRRPGRRLAVGPPTFLPAADPGHPNGPPGRARVSDLH